MTYSNTAMLALLVHLIVNYDALRNRHFRHDADVGKAYRWLMISVTAFYVSDILWGILYDAHLNTAVFLDTVVYFAAMTATVFLWTRFVICYLQEKNGFITFLRYSGWLFVFFVGIVLIMNCFMPAMFWFDGTGEYHASYMRYAGLAVQIILFASTGVYAMATIKDKPASVIRHHFAIGAFGIAMVIMVIMQVIYPLLPLYSIGCLLGTCILHTFILEDIKEDRRLELEEMFRREEEHRQELGSVRQLAYRDSLTGVKNTHAYSEAEKTVDERIANGELKEFGVIVFDVNDLKQINDTRGHEAGDELLRQACRLICRQFKHSPVYRVGGDEFVVMLEGEDYLNRDALMEDFEKITEENLHSESVVIAGGLAVLRPGEDHSYRSVFERADERMYNRKNELKSMLGRAKAR